MPDTMEATETIAFLAGSEPRVALVEALYRDPPLGTGALVDRCDAARVTITRNLEKLRDRGLVVDGTDGYRLTPLGALVAEEFLALVDTVETADELEPVLRRLPTGAFDLDPRALADAEVTVSTAANPYAPATRHAETLLTSSRARLLLPAVNAQAMADLTDHLDSEGVEFVFVVSADVAAKFRGELSEHAAELREADGLSLYEYDGDVPYFLGLVGGTVQIGVADEEGIPRALAESDAEEVRSWAEETYQSYRSDAEPFERSS